LEEFLFALHAVPRASDEVSEAPGAADGDFIDLGTPAHSGMTTSATTLKTAPGMAKGIAIIAALAADFALPAFLTN